MKVWIDADGCPVVGETIEICRRNGADCVICCDSAHELQREGAQTMIVSKGADSVDFALVNRIAKGDIAVTQDYGLAAMCLARGALVLNQDGRQYTGENIDGLLMARHEGRKARMAGGRTKGPPKRQKWQDQAFSEALETLLRTGKNEAGN